MSLIDAEQADKATLEAEDAVIREADKEATPEQFIPVGQDLAKLIAELSDGDAGGEGERGRAG